MMLWLAGVASAATVAVLDFDGYGVSFTEAQTVTQGMRDAFLEDGKLDPLSGSDIADGVSHGSDGGLRRARDLVAEGRRLYSGGDPAAALAPLTEAIGLHRAAYSDVGRRPELADATFLLGLCLQKTGRATEARARFDEAVFLVPHYAAERGQKMPDSAATLLASAEAALATGPRKSRAADDIRRIADALSVNYVVTGSINSDGALSAKMYADGRLVSEVKGALDEMPPTPVDGAYVALAQKLAAAGLAGPADVVADGAGDDGGEAEVPPDDAEKVLDDPPDFGEGDLPAPASGSGKAGAGGASGGGARTGATSRGASSAKIKTTGSLHYAQGPITERWWFWAGAVAVAGGGAFGVWYAVTPAPTEYVVEPDGWGVTVEGM